MKNGGGFATAHRKQAMVGLTGYSGILNLTAHPKTQETQMPYVSMFFGIIIRMFHNEHNPPHFHAEHQGQRGLFDFDGNMLKGNMKSNTANNLSRSGRFSIWRSCKITGTKPFKASRSTE